MTLRSRILATIGIAVLTACTAAPVSRVVDIQALTARAEAEVRAGNPGAAAQLYRQLADASAGTARAASLIEGARLAVAAGDPETASTWLNEARAVADSEQRQRTLVLQARIDLEAGRSDAALQTLSQLGEPLTLAIRTDAAELQGRALLRQGRYAEGIRVLADRETWLETTADIVANQRLIWDALPAQAPPPTGDPVIDGWLALAPLTRVQNDPEAFRAALLDWRRSFVDHPAAGVLLARLVDAQRAAGGGPARIALLLPLTTAQRPQAVAVRDGFMAARLQSPESSATTVTVYDTGRQSATSAYLQAQLDGADFIVGPLLRSDVDAVARQPALVPTLALNWAPDERARAASFYQFGLAPEDEIAAIAQQAYAMGHRTAVALVASDDRGYRLLATFRSAFEALGGTVLASAGYRPGGQDVSGTISDLLNITRSEQRHRRLDANLGVETVFEPRRRRDIDMIFVQADSRMGRLLAPNLRFYYAGDVPTFATSEVFDPPDPRGSWADLNGLIIPDMPLVVAPDQSARALASAIGAHWPERAAQLVRFYGLGFDAYRLAEALQHDDSAVWPMQALSGQLSIDAEGRIRRALPLGQFRDGRLVAIPLPAAAPQPELVGAR